MEGKDSDRTALTSNVTREDAMDTNFIRSLEGILRVVALILAMVGLVFIIASLFASVGGWYFFVGFSFIIYSIIFIVVETCIPNVHFHRLIDSIVVFAYAALFLIAAVLNTIFGVRDSVVLLGVSAMFGYLCGILCIIIAILSLKSWKTKGQQHQYNTAIF